MQFDFLFVDIQQLNLIMGVLGTPPEDFMSKISSESVRRIFNVEIGYFFFFLFIIEILDYGTIFVGEKLHKIVANYEEKGFQYSVPWCKSSCHRFIRENA